MANLSEEIYDTIIFDTIQSGNSSQSGGESLLPVIFTSICLGVITVITIVGNVFVIVAIIFAKHLRTVANSLILSLAIADLLVAVLVMPLGALYEIRQEWTLGSQLCDVWTSSDVLCCTASILHLLAIAVDRYWAVTHIHYIKSRTIRTIGTMIFLIWSLSIIVSLAPLFGWKDEEFDKRMNINKVCMVSQELSYQIFATMATFYVPLAIIILLYSRIFMTARRQMRFRLAQKAAAKAAASSGGRQARGKNASEGGPPLAGKRRTALKISFEEDVNQKRSSASPELAPLVEETTFMDLEKKDKNHRCKIHKTKVHINQAVQTDKPGSLHPEGPAPPPAPNKKKTKNKGGSNASSSSSAGPRNKKKSHTSLEIKRERKTAKILIIVTGVFIACWLPFFVLAIIMSIYKSWSYNQALVSTFLWLGYFNSALNPIIYTVFCPEFRTTFHNILFGRAINKHPAMPYK